MCQKEENVSKEATIVITIINNNDNYFSRLNENGQRENKNTRKKYKRQTGKVFPMVQGFRWCVSSYRRVVKLFLEGNYKCVSSGRPAIFLPVEI